MEREAPCTNKQLAGLLENGANLESEMNKSDKPTAAELVKMLRDAMADLSGVACDINMPEPPALAEAADAAMMAMEAADAFLLENQNTGLYDPWQDPIAEWISFFLRDQQNDAQEMGRDHRSEITFPAARLLSEALSMPRAKMTSSDVDRAEKCGRRFGLLRRDKNGFWEFVLPPKI